MINRLKASSAFVLFLVCTTAGAQQADRAQTEALSKRAADRLTVLHAEADRLATEERTLLGDLRRLELERQIKNEELRTIEGDSTKITAELSTLDQQIRSLEHREQLETPRLRARLVSLYKLGQGRYIRLLLSTTDVRQMAEAARMVTALAGQDQTDVARHQRRIKELTQTRTTLTDRRQALGSLRIEAGRARTAAEQAIVARNALISDIDQRRDLNAQFSGELQSAQQQLQATLMGLASGTSTATAGAASTLPLAPFRGDLDWPAQGSVRQAFGAAARGRAAATSGIDIATAEGTPVHAIHNGVVAFAGPFSGFGQLVIVEHGGQTFSLYGNLRETAVAHGARLAHGDTVGLAGVAASGAEGLYFELRIDGRPVDPVQWLKKR